MGKAEEDYEEARRRIAEATWAEHLDLSDLEALSELPPEIAELTALQELTLGGTDITWISSLENLTALWSLDLGGTEINEISSLENLTALETLALSDTKITEISSLENLTALQWLDLSGTHITEINSLENLTALRTLDLSGTKITEISSLENLTALQWLLLDDTEVADLRPIKGFSGLTAEGDFTGLHFANIPATKLDPKLAELSVIEDHQDRTRQTLDYLQSLGDDWPPVPDIPEDQPTAPSYSLDDAGQLHSEETLPADWDAEQAELQQDLAEKSRDLVTATGNSNDPSIRLLHSQAGRYRRIVERNSPDLPLKRLWSAANALRLAYEASLSAEEQGRLNDILPPAIEAALLDLVETHGLFIMGFPEAREIEATIRGYLTGKRNPDAVARGAEIAERLADEGILPEDEFEAVQADQEAATGAGASAEMGEISFLARIDNILFAMARKARKVIQYAAGAAATTVIGESAWAWICGNEPLIIEYLSLALAEASYWVPKIAQALRVLLKL